MTIEVRVPSLGESVTEATIATWFKKPGDAVAVDETLCELETDKVSLDVPSPVAGVLVEILALEGETVNASGFLATINQDASAAVSTAPLAAEPALPTAKDKDIEDAPAAKKAMAEARLSPADVVGTGRGGRVMKEDVARAQTATPIAPVPSAVLPRMSGPLEDQQREERVKMSRLRQTIARRLKEAQNTAAMLTTYNEVDMS
ncbi:MAG: E3 binding domain-containing protein, partial [Paracoccaceae bacterium]